MIVNLCEGLELRPDGPDLRPERPDSRLEWPDLRPDRPDWRPESSPVFYRTLSPSGPLPCFPSHKFTIMQSRATGVADQTLPLGDLLIVGL